MNNSADSLRSSRTKAIAYISVSVALIAVSAWVTIPIGPIPLTLQMFAIPLIICILPAKWAIATVCAYILLGAFGVPVFSNFGSGIGKLLGPTGGYLLGYIPATICASLIAATAKRMFANKKPIVFGAQILAGATFTAISYITGWIQYSNVAGIPLEVAFFTAVAPFILPDLMKVVAAVICAQPINALERLRTQDA